MIVGIDTSATRLDLIPTWRPFQLWNGGTSDASGNVTGGDAAFAGRNFLGGTFVCAPAEATNARAAPSPTDLSSLHTIVPRIAPIQAAFTARQQIANGQGFLYGQIDAQALCRRLAGKLFAGEFSLPTTFIVNVWLTVDPAAPISIDYWAGWANVVNTFVVDGRIGGDPSESIAYPFRAAILCRYTRGTNGRYQRDPNVSAMLRQTPLASYDVLDTSCNGFWADAPDPAGGVRPNPILDWTLFDTAEMPSIWRFSTSFTAADGTPANVSYSLDVVREPVAPSTIKPATEYMLETERWQPNERWIPTIGFINAPVVTDAQLTCMKHNPMPPMWEFADESNPTAAESAGHVQVRGGPVQVIGRYLRSSPAASFQKAEVKRICDAGVAMFTIYENSSTHISYFTQAQAITDGQTAFAYCGDTLRLPSHTPIYFTVDFDAADPSPAGVINGSSGGPDGKALVSAYFTELAHQRDLYAAAHPDRVYTIGVYGNGGVNDWMYSGVSGNVTHFWQSVSPGGSGNRNQEHNRPWYHANRWQYQASTSGHVPPGDWHCAPGFDPDADWGDGGVWNSNDPHEVALNDYIDRAPAIRRMIETMAGATNVGLVPR